MIYMSGPETCIQCGSDDCDELPDKIWKCLNCGKVMTEEEVYRWFDLYSKDTK